jgi:hypothetical protein
MYSVVTLFFLYNLFFMSLVCKLLGTILGQNLASRSQLTFKCDESEEKIFLPINCL